MATNSAIALCVCACCLAILLLGDYQSRVALESQSSNMFLVRRFPARERQAKVLSMLYEPQLDVGEDYFSAIQAPNKPYEWPWLKDGTFYRSAAADAYNGVNGYLTYPETYKRSPYDEFGDHAYDVDMRVADDCYDNDPEGPNANTKPGWDCYREVFDPATGYAREEPAPAAA